MSDNAAWLSLSPASGTAPGSATASVNLASLATGTYNATISLTATGATNTPKTVPVTLTVTAPVSQSAIVTSMVPDGFGATVTIQGPGQVLEFIYNAQSTYTGISSFTAGTTSFRHTFSWPQGTTFACYRTRGTDNLYTEQVCASVTPGPPPTSGTATLIWNASTSIDSSIPIWRSGLPTVLCPPYPGSHFIDDKYSWVQDRSAIIDKAGQYIFKAGGYRLQTVQAEFKVTQ